MDDQESRQDEKSTFKLIIENELKIDEEIEVVFKLENSSKKKYQNIYTQENMINIYKNYYLLSFDIKTKTLTPSFDISTKNLMNSILKKNPPLKLVINRIGAVPLKQIGELVNIEFMVKQNHSIYFLYSQVIKKQLQYELFFNYFMQADKITYDIFIDDTMVIFNNLNFHKYNHPESHFFWPILKELSINDKEQKEKIENKIDTYLIKELSLESCKNLLQFIGEDDGKLNEIIKKEDNVENCLLLLLHNIDYIPDISDGKFTVELSENNFKKLKLETVPNIFKTFRQLIDEIELKMKNIKIKINNFIIYYLELCKSESVKNFSFFNNFYLFDNEVKSFIAYLNEEKNKIKNLKKDIIEESLEKLLTFSDDIHKGYVDTGIKIIEKNGLLNDELINFIYETKLKFDNANFASLINIDKINKKSYSKLKDINVYELFSNETIKQKEENINLFYKTIFNNTDSVDLFSDLYKYIFNIFPPNGKYEKITINAVYNKYTEELIKLNDNVCKLNSPYDEKNLRTIMEIVSSYFLVNNAKINNNFFGKKTIDFSKKLLVDLFSNINNDDKIKNSYDNITFINDYLKENIFNISFNELNKVYTNKESLLIFYDNFTNRIIDENNFYKDNILNDDDYKLIDHFINNYYTFKNSFLEESSYWLNNEKITNKIYTNIIEEKILKCQLIYLKNLQVDDLEKRLNILSNNDSKNLNVKIKESIAKSMEKITIINNFYKDLTTYYEELNKEKTEKIQQLKDLINTLLDENQETFKSYTKEKLKILTNFFAENHIIKENDFYNDKLHNDYYLFDHISKLISGLNRHTDIDCEKDYKETNYYSAITNVFNKIINDINEGNISILQLYFLEKLNGIDSLFSRMNIITLHDVKENNELTNNLNLYKLIINEVEALVKLVEPFNKNKKNYNLKELENSLYNTDAKINEFWTSTSKLNIKVLEFLEKYDLINENDFFNNELNDDYLVLEFILNNDKFKNDLKGSNYYKNNNEVMKKIVSNILDNNVSLCHIYFLLNMDEWEEKENRFNLNNRLNIISENNEEINKKLINKMLEVKIIFDELESIFNFYNDLYKTKSNNSKLRELIDKISKLKIEIKNFDLNSNEDLLNIFNFFDQNVININDLYIEDTNIKEEFTLFEFLTNKTIFTNILHKSSYYIHTKSIIESFISSITSSKISIKNISNLLSQYENETQKEAFIQKLNILTEKNNEQKEKILNSLYEFNPLINEYKKLSELYNKHNENKISNQFFKEIIKKIFTCDAYVIDLHLGKRKEIDTLYTFLVENNLIKENDFYTESINNDYFLLNYLCNCTKLKEDFLKSKYWTSSEVIIQQIMIKINNGLISTKKINYLLGLDSQTINSSSSKDLTLLKGENQRPNLISRLNLLSQNNSEINNTIITNLISNLKYIKELEKILSMYEALSESKKNVQNLKDQIESVLNSDTCTFSDIKNNTSNEVQKIFNFFETNLIKEENFYKEELGEDFFILESLSGNKKFEINIKYSTYWDESLKIMNKIIDDISNGNLSVKRINVLEEKLGDLNNNDRPILTQRLNIITQNNEEKNKFLIEKLNNYKIYIDEIDKLCKLYQQTNQEKDNTLNVKVDKLFNSDINMSDPKFNEAIIDIFNYFEKHLIKEKDFFCDRLNNDFNLLEFIINNDVYINELKKSNYYINTKNVMNKIIEDLTTGNVDIKSVKALEKLDKNKFNQNKGQTQNHSNYEPIKDRKKLLQRLNLITQKDTDINNQIIEKMNEYELIINETYNILDMYKEYNKNEKDIESLNKLLKLLLDDNILIKNLNLKEFFNFFEKNSIIEKDFYSNELGNNYLILEYFINKKVFDKYLWSSKYGVNSLKTMKAIVDNIINGNVSKEQVEMMKKLDGDVDGDIKMRTNLYRRFMIVSQDNEEVISNMAKNLFK